MSVPTWGPSESSFLQSVLILQAWPCFFIPTLMQSDSWKGGTAHTNANRAWTIEILVLEDARWKKGRIFFSWTPTYFVLWGEVLLSPVKIFYCSKLPCLGWRSALFTRVFFAKNVCWTSANILVLVLRFLWLEQNFQNPFWNRIPFARHLRRLGKMFHLSFM
jgi:hypothetical protein